MIERIPMRVGEFVGSTARRTVNALEELIPGLEPPKRRRQLLTPGRVVAGAAATAIGLLSANSSTRDEIVERVRELTGGKRNGSANRNSHGKAARSVARTTVDLTEKTRDELY